MPSLYWYAIPRLGLRNIWIGFGRDSGSGQTDFLIASDIGKRLRSAQVSQCAVVTWTSLITMMTIANRM
jgi:hypothetical protein